MSLGLAAAGVPSGAPAQRGPRIAPAEPIAEVLRETRPLTFPLGRRLPLYVWAAANLPGDDAEVGRTLRALADRGIAAYASWASGQDGKASIARAVRMSAAQQRLKLRVSVNATDTLYGIFDGSPETAHVDAQGQPFFDMSSSATRKLGCPFAIGQRIPAVRSRVEAFCRAYQSAGVGLDFVFADWEIDGPIEWNGGWDAARKCVRCRQNIADLDRFESFQKAYRAVRSRIQRESYTSVVLRHFPSALVGNYGVYPSGGWRYWYDYYESEAGPGVAVRSDQGARYRPWPDEFTPGGYTLAMPVVYTWYRTWNWYNFADADYRWFYNLLLAGSDPAAHRPARVPIISFVHWTTTSPPRDPDPHVKQFSEEAYRELLWHLLLRGHDSFFLWCPPAEIAAEIRPVHQVWAASLEYQDFLSRGVPVTFETPQSPGPVISGLRLGDRVLVRRTDFGGGEKHAEPLMVDGMRLDVPPARGRCQILVLPGGDGQSKR